MDYDVTKHIFHHFYGEQACYEGYMSKFLSREPFRYSITSIMIQTFETQLGEKLGIQTLWKFFSRFRERLAESSLRDLHKLTQFETKFYIKQDEYIYSGGSMSTSLPLFHLIIYMMESGMSTEAIQADLLSLCEGGFQYSNEIEIEFIRLMYPVYILHFPNVKYIRGRKMVYFLELEKKADCSEVHVGLSGSWVEDSSLPLNLEKFDKVVMRFLKTLSDSMNLSALRLD